MLKSTLQYVSAKCFDFNKMVFVNENLLQWNTTAFLSGRKLEKRKERKKKKTNPLVYKKMFPAKGRKKIKYLLF